MTRALAAEVVHRDGRAQRQSDRGAEHHRREAYAQAQQHDADELGVGRCDERERLGGGVGDGVHCGVDVGMNVGCTLLCTIVQ